MQFIIGQKTGRWITKTSLKSVDFISALEPIFENAPTVSPGVNYCEVQVHNFNIVGRWKYLTTYIIQHKVISFCRITVLLKQLWSKNNKFLLLQRTCRSWCHHQIFKYFVTNNPIFEIKNICSRCHWKKMEI